MPTSASLRTSLAVALKQLRKLQREIAAMKRDAELIWAAERIETALFRERINDVAYEVVRITQAIESPGSSIEPMQAYAALVVGHGRRTQILDIDSASGEASAPTINRGALANHIRALRTTASRAGGELSLIFVAAKRPRAQRSGVVRALVWPWLAGCLYKGSAEHL